MPRRNPHFFPVSVDRNDDGEVWDFTDTFGDRALRLWDEFLSLAEKTANEIPWSPQQLAAVSRKIRQSPATVSRAIGWMLAKHWLIIGQALADGSPTILRVHNYLKYHPIRGAHQNTSREQASSPPSDPSYPSYPKKKRDPPIVPLTGDAPWPSPEKLVQIYNKEAADELPTVTQLSPDRRKKALKYLKAFPEEDFWHEVFKETRLSSLLRGLRNGDGHENFKGDFDWLLTKGKDGTENCLKTYEGKYRDAQSKR